MVRCDVGQLVTAAGATASHGDELAARHLAADNRIDGAVAGWAGRSAAALRTRASAWPSTTTALLTRVAAHAASLHTCAMTFTAAEQYAGRTLHLVG